MQKFTLLGVLAGANSLWTKQTNKQSNRANTIIISPCWLEYIVIMTSNHNFSSIMTFLFYNVVLIYIFSDLSWRNVYDMKCVDFWKYFCSSCAVAYPFSLYCIMTIILFTLIKGEHKMFILGSKSTFVTSTIVIYIKYK